MEARSRQAAVALCRRSGAARSGGAGAGRLASGGAAAAAATRVDDDDDDANLPGGEVARRPRFVPISTPPPSLLLPLSWRVGDAREEAREELIGPWQAALCRTIAGAAEVA